MESACVRSRRHALLRQYARERLEGLTQKSDTTDRKEREREGGRERGKRECIEAGVGVSLETNFVNCELKQHSRAEDSRPMEG
jgi:hypothetical protein